MRARPFAGRTELDVHRELVERMLALGHERANFAIVAAAEHAASPHHEPSAERVIREGEIVLCDFGGTMHGYCSDITRMFHVGEAPSRGARRVRRARRRRRRPACTRRPSGRRARTVDAAAAPRHRDAGFGEYFVHRVGHGIGTEAHEDPYMVAGNERALEPGHAFSVEPGIYFPGRFGMRLEDIVVATHDGPLRLNNAARDLAIVVVKLDGATFLLQWATGGLFFGWVTTRRREVSLGYGWLIRITFGLMALGAFGLFVANDHPDAAALALRVRGRGRGRARWSPCSGAPRARVAARSCARHGARVSRR